MKNLVIVESPAKAKTIEKYLGKDFHVLSSVGHIRSIVKKTKDGTPPIDVANDFFAVYEVDPEKKKVITELKKNVKAVGKDNVWLATDEDREGEAIAWHLCKVLDLPIKTTKRIVFHEITKDAITNAIKNPRTVDMKRRRRRWGRRAARLVRFPARFPPRRGRFCCVSARSRRFPDNPRRGSRLRRGRARRRRAS